MAGAVVDTQPGTGVATVPDLANFSVASRQLSLNPPRARMHLRRYRYFGGALSSAELAAVTVPRRALRLTRVVRCGK